MQIKENLFHYFEKAGATIQYHPKDIIYMQEDDASCLYLIKSGKVRISVFNQTGEEITLEILSKGKIFGESSFMQNSLRPTSAQALNDVELIACRLDDLYPYLSESKELTISLLQLMSQTCDYLSSLVKKAYTYNRYEKVAAFLLEQNNQVLTFTHEEIASLIGLSRVTVTKVLNEFVKNQYITIKYKKVTITNRKALSRLLAK